METLQRNVLNNVRLTATFFLLNAVIPLKMGFFLNGSSEILLFYLNSEFPLQNDPPNLEETENMSWTY